MTSAPRAKKRLGQNFLVRPETAAEIVEFAELDRSDTIVEVGAGTGVLTAELARRAGRVLAFEIDPVLVRLLRRRFENIPSIEIIPGDFLKTAARYLPGLPSFKAAANPPYYISTPIIFTLLEYMPALKLMVLTLQKEVGRRLAAKPGGSNYGVLSLTVGAYARVEEVKTLGKGAFRPAPTVDSAVIRFLPHGQAALPAEKRAEVLKLVRQVFTFRRKTIRNGLTRVLGVSAGTAEEIITACGLDPLKRPEELSLGDYLLISTRAGKTRRGTGSVPLPGRSG